MAITGKAFEFLIMQRDTAEPGNTEPAEIVKRIVRNATVFARMSPEDKAQLIVELQNDTGEIIAMWGDGANDCNALKTADVGLSLSEAEASIAAPFTSKIPDISPMIKLLREGRASLVTSFWCFKYMEIYSMIQFWSVVILYRIASNLGDFQFLYIDLFNIIPLSFLLGRTSAYKKLTKRMPTGSLVSLPILLSMGTQLLLIIGSQIGVYIYLISLPWFVALDPSDDKNTEWMENTTLFTFSVTQYVLVISALTIGKPFRKPVYTNIGLWIWVAILIALSYVLILTPPKFLKSILQIETIDKIPNSFKIFIVVASLVTAVVSYLLEYILVVNIVEKLISKRRLANKIKEK